MARRNIPQPEVIPPSVTPEQGIALLQRLIPKGEELLANRPLESVQHNAWENRAKEYLSRAFASNSPHLRTFSGISSATYINQSEDFYERQRAEELTEQLVAIRSLIETL